MALFCAAVRRDSVSFLKFPFLSHVQVFLWEISLVCHLKCPYCCFLPIFVSRLFCFSWCLCCLFCSLWLYSVFLRVFIYFSGYFIDESTLSWMLESPLSPFFLHIQFTVSSLGCKALCTVMSFLVIWSICWSSSLVLFRNDPEYLTRRTAQVFILLIIFLLCSLPLSNFLVLLVYSF